MPGGLYRFELQQTQGVAPGRVTELVPHRLSGNLIGLALNLQLNGNKYSGELRLCGGANHASCVERLKTTAKKLDEVGWVTKSTSATSIPSGEGRRAMSARAVTTLMGYAPGTETVVPPSRTDLVVQPFLKEIARLLIGWNKHLIEVKSFQQIERRRHSSCVNTLSVFTEESDQMREKGAEAISALRAAEVALQALHMHKVRLIRNQISDLDSLQQSLQDGSWKRQ